jgi:hypothetical protein
LPNKQNKIWEDGFRAGQTLEYRLPYPDGSREAKVWLEGWVQGLHVPERLSDDLCESNVPSHSLVSLWRRFFRKLFRR